MKYIILALFISTTILAQAQTKNFHDFEAKTISGETIKMSDFKGKKLLVVNVASKCGFTPQYEELQKLYETYGGDNFEIIGFPANNFMKQEPGTDEEIKSFCKVNYGVTFTMMSKISVKGNDIDPIYQWLTTKDENGVMDAPIKWNFQKFLIDENGNLVAKYAPKDKPLGGEIEKWVSGK
jgi:glutathione peroxidase